MRIVITAASRAFLITVALMAVLLYVATAIEMREADKPVRIAAQDAPEARFTVAVARKFPDCLPVELWRSEIRPTSLLVVSPRGAVRRMALDPKNSGLGPKWPKVEVIGVC